METTIDPLVRYANYRQECKEAVEAGKGLGLFGPMFVTLYDSLVEAREELRIAKKESEYWEQAFYNKADGS